MFEIHLPNILCTLKREVKLILIILRGVQLIYLIKVSTATVSKESKGIVSYIRYKIFSRFSKLYSFKCELLTKLGEFVPHLLGEVQFRYLTKECTANVSY